MFLCFRSFSFRQRVRLFVLFVFSGKNYVAKMYISEIWKMHTSFLEFQNFVSWWPPWWKQGSLWSPGACIRDIRVSWELKNLASLISSWKKIRQLAADNYIWITFSNNFFSILRQHINLECFSEFISWKFFHVKQLIIGWFHVNISLPKIFSSKIKNGDTEDTVKTKQFLDKQPNAIDKFYKVKKKYISHLMIEL